MNTRQKYKAAGLCIYCGKPLAPTSISVCDYHARYLTELRKRHAHLYQKKEYRDSSRRRWRERHPDKKAAQLAVYEAIKRGMLIRPMACSSCNSPCRPEAHHADYSKRLDVIWLCRACHLAEEARLRVADKKEPSR